jgi:hypothetical protein
VYLVPIVRKGKVRHSFRREGKVMETVIAIIGGALAVILVMVGLWLLDGWVNPTNIGVILILLILAIIFVGFGFIALVGLGALIVAVFGFIGGSSE